MKHTFKTGLKVIKEHSTSALGFVVAVIFVNLAMSNAAVFFTGLVMTFQGTIRPDQLSATFYSFGWLLSTALLSVFWLGLIFQDKKPETVEG